MGRRTRDGGVEKDLWSSKRMGMVAFRCFDPERRTSSQCLGAICKKKMAPKVENRGLCLLGRIMSTFNGSQRGHRQRKLEDWPRQTKTISPTPRPRQSTLTRPGRAVSCGTTASSLRPASPLTMLPRDSRTRHSAVSFIRVRLLVRSPPGKAGPGKPNREKA